MGASRTVDIEELLAHEGFLRALALRLVRDPATADDLVQETWVAALSTPPRRRASTRGWLTIVARNAARMRARAEARRARREASAARPVAAPSTEDLLERERARRSLLGAVFRLDEPYRSTIVLRFYEGLPPRDVAKRMQVPVETVRTRTRRALARMRVDLDEKQGDRRNWRALLAPLTTASPPAGPLFSPLLGGTLAMLTSSRIAVVGMLLLVGAGVWFVQGLHTDPETQAGGTDMPGLSLGEGDEGPVLAGRAEGGKDADTEPDTPSRASPTLDIFRKQRSQGRLRGIVLSGRTHKPVANARVFAVFERGVVPDGMHLSSLPMEGDSTRTDARGRFVFPALPLGAYAIEVEHDTEGVARETGVAAEDAPWIRLYPLPENKDLRSHAVRVVDPSGRPVDGARVICTLGLGTEPIVVSTDAEGLATFTDLPDVGSTIQGWITASAPEGLGRVRLGRDLRSRRSQEKPREIVLRAAGVLEGALQAPAGHAVTGIEVQALSLTGGGGLWATIESHATTSDADGAFRFEALPAGPFTLLVPPQGGLRMQLEQGNHRGPEEWVPLRAVVEPGRTTAIDVPLVVGAGIRGRVRTSAGAPVSQARVEIHLPQGPPDYSERVTRGGVPLWRLDGPWPDSRRFPLTFRTLQTDAEGRYELTGLLPGRYRIRVIAGEGLAFDRRMTVPLRDGQTTELEHVLEPAGTLELVAQPFDTLGFRRRDSQEVAISLVTPRSALAAITIPSFPTGAWEVVLLHSDPGVAPVPLSTFEMHAGSLTYLDVSQAGNATVTLRVLDRGRPVAGALVSEGGYPSALSETDPEGLVRLHMGAFPRTEAWPIRVELPDPDAALLSARVPLDREEIALPLPTGGLRVVVRAPDGQVVPGSVVRLQPDSSPVPAPAGAAPGGRIQDQGRSTPLQSEGRSSRRTNAAGVARWRHLSPGRFRVEAELPETHALVGARVVVADATTEVVLQAEEPAEIRLRVLDDTGAPAAQTHIGADVLPPEHAQKGWNAAISLTRNGWRTGADGRFTIRGVPAGRLRVSAWRRPKQALSATHNATVERDVEAGAVVELELRLRPVGQER